MNDSEQVAPLIRAIGLTKSYGGVRALTDLELEIGKGEVHAVCGENGAGKSTLIKLLTGVVPADRGQIRVNGEPLRTGHVSQAEQLGIAVMHQESTVFPDLTAIENVFVGHEPTFAAGWVLNRRLMRRQASALFSNLGEHFNIDVPVRELSVAQRQIVALARALARNCRLLIMDEPTASLSARETKTLLKLARKLRSDGVSVLYVSHRLEEIFQIADRVTVLRDGRHVVTRPISEVTRQQLVQWMVGREVDELTRRQTRDSSPGETRLEVQKLAREGVFYDVSLTVRAGEIVGLAGLIGAGRSEVARAVFGIDHYDGGSVRVGGKRLAAGSVQAAMALGLALVPEDRQHEGLVLPMSVGENLSLAMIRCLGRFGFVRRRREQELIEKQIQSLQIRVASTRVPAETLSGGNQQRLVVGKWLAREPRVLMLDEPTRGIDVGAKAQVHRLIRQLADRGVAILLISSDLPELLAISDRILVMRQGRLAGEVSGGAATQEQVLAMALPDAEEVVQA